MSHVFKRKIFDECNIQFHRLTPSNSTKRRPAPGLHLRALVSLRIAKDRKLSDSERSCTVMDVSAHHCAVSNGNGAHPLLRRVRLWLCYFSLQVYFLLFLPSISADKFGVEVTRLIDDETLEKCNIDLIRSDQNDNGELDSNEFVSLIDSLSEGRIHGESFSDIPLRLRMVFHWSACSCIFEADEMDSCCIGAAAHVDVDEAQSSLPYIMNEVFCSELAQGIRDVEDMFLTPSPTLPPTPSPTNLQTTSLTSSPSTSPSTDPVASPTVTPTSIPTNNPSLAPMTTGSPTRMTALPTASPTQGKFLAGRCCPFRTLLTILFCYLR